MDPAGDHRYDEYPEIEEEFSGALDESLAPRGPEMLFGIVARFSLSPGSVAVDVGCGEGRHAYELAERFGISVTGIDPSYRCIDTAQSRSASPSPQPDRDPATRVRFLLGSAESLPLPDSSVDLVWCRDVLVHVRALGRAYGEFARVMRRGARAVVYQSSFATERLEQKEARLVFSGLGVCESSTDTASHDAAISGAGLRVVEISDIGLEWGERSQERDGSAGRRLLHTARLLRDPKRFLDRFGR